jgi:pimeloyl-ACP methyl ester carboxylesterase
MQRLLRLLPPALLFPAALCAAAPEAPAAAPVLVSVHGAWSGGWHMKKVAPLLEAAGWKVYRSSLPGLGEHHPLATAAIGLEEHITDIVNLILFEDLHRVILLGHGYGGMVITGVADRIPERIARLVYCEAYVPADGDSVFSQRSPERVADLVQQARDGLVPARWVKPGTPPPIHVPQPLKTFSDPLTLKNPSATATIPATYLLTVEAGKAPAEDDFFFASERARARGWPVRIITGDHNPHWRHPEAFASLLQELK